MKTVRWNFPHPNIILQKGWTVRRNHMTLTFDITMDGTPELDTVPVKMQKT